MMSMTLSLRLDFSAGKKTQPQINHWLHSQQNPDGGFR